MKSKAIAKKMTGVIKTAFCSSRIIKFLKCMEITVLVSTILFTLCQIFCVCRMFRD